jgi:hypothetical protein
MGKVYFFFIVLLLIVTILPKISSSHWIFRVADFGKIQITFFAAVTFAVGFFFYENQYWWCTQGI